MATKLSDFLIEVSQNPEKLEDYALNRDQVLAESGLSREHQEALATDDLTKVREEIEKERPGEEVRVVFFVC